MPHLPVTAKTTLVQCLPGFDELWLFAHSFYKNFSNKEKTNNISMSATE